jgi:hypothetical protein
MKTKMNVGCGTDYREGYINIDGSSSLTRVDIVLDITGENLLSAFQVDHFKFILANDIIEHHFHWEAVALLNAFFRLLRKDGLLEIRVPDAKYIINSWRMSVNQKINLLFGGQDIPQGVDTEMDASRKVFPHFFCHKYGWTRESIVRELQMIGFSFVKTRRCGTNFVATATK